MTSFEYGGTVVRVPDHWGELTLGDYEEAMSLPRATLRERVAVVARLCGTEAATLLTWPAEAFAMVAGHLSFVWGDFETPPSPRARIGGLECFVNTQDALTLGEWVDVEQVQREGSHPIARILAIVCRPAGEQYDSARNAERAALFSAAPVAEVQGVLAFFLRSWQNSERISALCSRVREAASYALHSTSLSPGVGGGTRSSTSWRSIAFWISTAWPRYRLRRFLHTSSTAGSGARRRKRSRPWRRH